MKTRFVAAAMLAAMAACAGVALAGPYSPVPYEPQPRPEVYIFGYGGVTWINELEATSTSVGGYALEISADDGFGVGGGIGLRFPVFLGGSRLEVEGYFRSNDAEGVRPNNAPFGGKGDVSMNGVMLNFVKEFAWNGVVPYLGMGIGFGQTEVDVSYNNNASIHADETSLTWQGIAGMEFPFWQRVSLYAEYRYMSVGDFTMDAVRGGIGTTLMNFDDLATHSVFGGIRIYF